MWWQNESLLPFNTPCAAVLSGPSLSGKTSLMMQILQHSRGMFEKPPDRIVYAYTQHQPLFLEMARKVPSITFHEGVPNPKHIEGWTKDKTHTVLVLDDMIERIVNDVDAMTLFTVHCHHKCVSVFLLSQNIFQHGRFARSISLNISYYILLKNPRDRQQATTLLRQAFPKKGTFVADALQKAHSSKYGYLCVDLSPSSSEDYRLRTNILPNEDTIIYQPL